MLRSMRILLTALLLAAWSLPALAENHLNSETIKAGLRTTTIEEEGFVDRVLDLVVKGKLQASTVESTFLWARRKPKNRYQYFKKAIIQRAVDEGQDLQ